MAQKKETNKFGKLAEDYATSFLSQKGYKIINRNFRSRFGEIDIIALKDGYLVFIEVKARRSLLFGAPEESVGWSKIYKIRKTADYFSMLHPNLPKLTKIEILSMIVSDGRVKDIKTITLD